MQDPLVLNGHSQKQVRSVRFDVCGTRLASGGADGSVVIWDIIAETGLYRLLGHRGGITDISFASPTTHLDALITSSLDGLVKIWDLKGQCCTQTIASHRGEVWASACLNTAHILDETENDNTPSTEKQDHRWRLVTGSTDGQVRVWSIHEPQRASSNTSSTTADHPQDSADEAKVSTLCIPYRFRVTNV
jgi:U3 small nucleolar RNA-associated protein 12